MGGRIATIVGWMMFLILVYLLLAHGQNTTSIVTSSAKGASNIIVALQGNAKQAAS
jgi:hypothetical protein